MEKTLRRGGNSKDRRRYRRALGLLAVPVCLATGVPDMVIMPPAPQPPSLDDTHPIGTPFRLTTDEYGKSYNRAKGTVTGYDNGKVMLKVADRLRKSPLLVAAEHLEAA